MERESIVRLARAAKKGDSVAFSQLCETKSDDILFLCIKLMGDRHEGEDAAQEVLLRMQQGIRRLRNPDTFPSWLNRIVYNTCFTKLGKNSKNKLEFGSVPTDIESEPEDNIEFLPDAYAERSDLRACVSEGLDALPYQYKSALYMYYYEQLSVKEMALMLRMSEKAVYKLLARARGALKRKLSGQHSLLQGAVPAVPATVLGRILVEEAKTVTAASQGKLVLPPLVASAAAAGGAATGAAGAGATGAVSGASVGSIVLGISGAALFTAAAVAAAIIPQGSTSGPGEWLPPESLTASVAVYSAAPDVLYSSSGVSQPDGRTPSPGASSPSEVSEEVPEQTLYPATFSGRVGFKDREGNTVAAGVRYTAGLRIEVYADGKLAGAATVRADGSYTLGCTAAQGAVCTIRLASGALSPTADNPGGEYSFTFAGDAALPTLYVTDAVAPAGAVDFLNADLEAEPGGHGNPQGAVLHIADATETTATWTLCQNGAPVASGSGTQVPLSPAALAPAEGVGWYTLEFEMTDAAGNTATISRDFYVFSS